MALNLKTNPLRAGLAKSRNPEPCIIVIFGGTGDLAMRKLLPALYQLYIEDNLPRTFGIVSYASADMTDEQYREMAREAVFSGNSHHKPDTLMWEKFAGSFRYVKRDKELVTSVKSLAEKLDGFSNEMGVSGNYLFYFSVPPFVYKDYADALGQAGLSNDEKGGWRRLVLEKPFGTDYESAKDLNQSLQEVFSEEQIYRIDHYLGKETVQNILAFRFANRIIDPLFNSHYVDSIQVTVAESLGVEGRGGYYDSTGALRDMIQNHALQILSFVLMEPPVTMDGDGIRDEKVKVFRSIRTPRIEEVDLCSVRGQYTSGYFGGKNVPGYLEEDKVAEDSLTETYAAVRLFVDNWRWAGVPIYLRTGKRLARRVTEIALTFKKVPSQLFSSGLVQDIRQNTIAINIQPEEGISAQFVAKPPGVHYRLQPVRMDFKYGSSFQQSVPDAYERLLLDAMKGDQSLFARADGTEATWAVVDPIIKGWEAQKSVVHSYMPGSWGPKAADELLSKDGRRWRRP